MLHIQLFMKLQVLPSRFKITAKFIQFAVLDFKANSEVIQRSQPITTYFCYILIHFFPNCYAFRGTIIVLCAICLFKLMNPRSKMFYYAII